jgi:diguanylate cyclase (GGDEF)-like protein
MHREGAMEEHKNRRILIVDDNRAIHEDYRKILGAAESVDAPADALAAFEAQLFGAAAQAGEVSYELTSAFQGQEADVKIVELAARGERFALAFVDMHMPPGWDGVQTIARIWERDPEVQVVICSAYSEYSWEQLRAAFGSTDRLLILKKPFDMVEVRQLASALSEKWNLARRAELKLAELKSMVEEQTQELRTANERLSHDAFHDALTGLPNRLLLIDRVRQCLLRAHRDPELGFALLFIDLDHFKLTNDTMGHAAGDDLLKLVAERLVRSLRASDSVAYCPQNEVARLGGDEFVVLLEGLRHEGDAMRVAERLSTAFASPIHVAGKDLFVSMSVGIALGRPDYESAEDMLRDADTALYRAKANGRGTYAVFDADMHAAVMSRWWIENELRSAIERGELRLVYQPVLSIEGGRLCEFEALLRWQHPERGNIPPAEFIPVAEEAGLIAAIGKWVLEAALSQLRAWREQLVDLPDFAVAVNVSAKQLDRPEFVEELTQLLRQYDMPGHRIRLEVTESAVMKESGAPTLARLRELEVRFHLDDFGTGYSSLSYLHRLPVDALKIDRSFVNLMPTDPVSASVVESIILLAHTLGAEVIAEGVETPEQLARLRALRCNMAQGYLFSRPVPVVEASAFLDKARLERALAASAVDDVVEING